MIYDPTNWYWQAEDGRVFASARQQIVPEDDPDLVKFAEVQMPTLWPRDDAGEQTDAELQKVLDPYGVFVTLQAYAANERWKAETGGITSSAGVPLKTDDRSKALIIGAGLLATNDPSFSTTWVGADGALHPLDNAQLKEQVGDLQRHIDACFAAFSDVITQLEAKKISSHQQIVDRFKAVKR